MWQTEQVSLSNFRSGRVSHDYLSNGPLQTTCISSKSGCSSWQEVATEVIGQETLVLWKRGCLWENGPFAPFSLQGYCGCPDKTLPLSLLAVNIYLSSQSSKQCTFSLNLETLLLFLIGTKHLELRKRSTGLFLKVIEHCNLLSTRLSVCCCFLLLMNNMNFLFLWYPLRHDTVIVQKPRRIFWGTYSNDEPER